MGRADYFSAGSWNVVCDQCGEKYKSHQLRKQWDGLMVCKRCWEPRHPQDLIRPIKDDPGVPWSRPDQPPIFVSPNPGQYPGMLGSTTLDGDMVG